MDFFTFVIIGSFILPSAFTERKGKLLQTTGRSRESLEHSCPCLPASVCRKYQGASFNTELLGMIPVCEDLSFVRCCGAPPLKKVSFPAALIRDSRLDHMTGVSDESNEQKKESLTYKESLLKKLYDTKSWKKGAQRKLKGKPRAKRDVETLNSKEEQGKERLAREIENETRETTESTLLSLSANSAVRLGQNNEEHVPQVEDEAGGTTDKILSSDFAETAVNPEGNTPSYEVMEMTTVSEPAKLIIDSTESMTSSPEKEMLGTEKTESESSTDIGGTHPDNPGSNTMSDSKFLETKPFEVDPESSTDTDTMMRSDNLGFSTTSYLGQHETEETNEAQVTESYQERSVYRSGTSQEPTDDKSSERDTSASEVMALYSTGENTAEVTEQIQRATDKSILATSLTKSVSASKTFPIDFSKVKKSKYLEVKDKIESQVAFVYAEPKGYQQTTDEKNPLNPLEIKTNEKESDLPQKYNLVIQPSGIKSTTNELKAKNNRHHIQHIPSGKRIKIYKKINPSEENAIKELIYDSFRNKSLHSSDEIEKSLKTFGLDQSLNQERVTNNVSEKGSSPKKDTSENLEASQSSRVQIYVRKPSSSESTDSLTGEDSELFQTKKLAATPIAASKVSNLMQLSSINREAAEIEKSSTLAPNEQLKNRQVNRGKIKFKESIMKELKELYISSPRPLRITRPLTNKEYLTETTQTTETISSAISDQYQIKSSFKQANLKITLPVDNLHSQNVEKNKPPSSSENKPAPVNLESITVEDNQKELKDEDVSMQAQSSTVPSEVEPSSYAEIKGNDSVTHKHELKSETSNQTQSSMRQNGTVLFNYDGVNQKIQAEHEEGGLKNEFSTRAHNRPREHEARQNDQVKNERLESTSTLTTHTGSGARRQGAKLPNYIGVKQHDQMEHEFSSPVQNRESGHEAEPSHHVRVEHNNKVNQGGLKYEFPTDAQSGSRGNQTEPLRYVGVKRNHQIKYEKGGLNDESLTHAEGDTVRDKGELTINGGIRQNHQVKDEEKGSKLNAQSSTDGNKVGILSHVDAGKEDQVKHEYVGPKLEFSTHVYDDTKEHEVELPSHVKAGQNDQVKHEQGVLKQKFSLRAQSIARGNERGPSNKMRVEQKYKDKTNQGGLRREFPTHTETDTTEAVDLKHEQIDKSVFAQTRRRESRLPITADSETDKKYDRNQNSDMNEQEISVAETNSLGALAVQFEDETSLNKNLFKPPEKFESGFVPIKNVGSTNAMLLTDSDNFHSHSHQHQQQLSPVPLKHPQNIHNSARPTIHEESVHVSENKADRIPSDSTSSSLGQHVQTTQRFNPGTRLQFHEQPYEQDNQSPETLLNTEHFQTLGNPTEAPSVSLIRKMPEFIKQQLSSIFNPQPKNLTEVVEKDEITVPIRTPTHRQPIRSRDRVHPPKRTEAGHETQKERQRTRHTSGSRRRTKIDEGRGQEEVTKINEHNEEQSQIIGHINESPLEAIASGYQLGPQFTQQNQLQNKSTVVTEKEKIRETVIGEEESLIKSQSVDKVGRRQFVGRRRLKVNRQESQYEMDGVNPESQKTTTERPELEKNSRYSKPHRKSHFHKFKPEHGASKVSPAETKLSQNSSNVSNTLEVPYTSVVTSIDSNIIKNEARPSYLRLPTRNTNRGRLTAETTVSNNFDVQNPNLLISNSRKEPAAFISGPARVSSPNFGYQIRANDGTPMSSLIAEEMKSNNVNTASSSFFNREVTNIPAAVTAGPEPNLSHNIVHQSFANDQIYISTTPTAKGDILLLNEEKYLPIRSMLGSNLNIESKRQGISSQGSKSKLKYPPKSQALVHREFQDASAGIPFPSSQDSKNTVTYNSKSQTSILSDFQDISTEKSIVPSQGARIGVRYNLTSQTSVLSESQDGSTERLLASSKEGAKNGVSDDAMLQHSVLKAFQDISTEGPFGLSPGARNGVRTNPMSQLIDLTKSQDIFTKSPNSMSKGARGKVKYKPMTGPSVPSESQSISRRKLITTTNSTTSKDRKVSQFSPQKGISMFTKEKSQQESLRLRQRGKVSGVTHKNSRITQQSNRSQFQSLPFTKTSEEVDKSNELYVRAVYDMLKLLRA